MQPSSNRNTKTTTVKNSSVGRRGSLQNINTAATSSASKIPQPRPPSANNKKPFIPPRTTVTTNQSSKTTSNGFRPPVPSKTTSKPITQTASDSKAFPAIRGKKIDNKKYKLEWSDLPLFVYAEVFGFACLNVWDVLKLTHVCKNWRLVVEAEEFLLVWERLKVKIPIRSVKQMREFTKQTWIATLLKSYNDFQKMFVRLFDYGSTKQNIPNKLLSKMDIQIDVKFNKMVLQNIPFKLRNFNFSSYLVAKIVEISQHTFDFSSPHNMFKEKIDLQLTLKSRKYHVAHTITKKYYPEEIYQRAVRQKAFNYYLDKNIVFTLFEGDNHFIYMLLQFSALELVTELRKAIRKQTKMLQLNMPKLKKQLCETEFEDFTQYFRYQTDFQVHMSFHNSEKQIFTHCDTKAYPVQYDKKSAYFDIKINDSFPIQKTFKLDNKMGMSQFVSNLYLLDLVLKDRDKFILTFSGFIYGKTLTSQEKHKLDNFMRIGEAPVTELVFKCEAYEFEMIVIEEKTRIFMPYLKLTLYPKINQ